MAEFEINAVFRKPFDEQAAFFRHKLGNLLPSEKWTDIQKSQHDKGFMVAGAATVELLTDLFAAVDRTIVAGDSLDMFRKNFKSIVKANGWDYNGDFNWRTRTIYQTNISTSYNAGRLAQLLEGDFLYWVYIHSKTVQHPRKEHLAWDGITLSPDDPWWQSHFTPNGFGCQCRVKGTNRPPKNARLTAPDDPIDPATGEPKGIGAGWGYMPGQTVSDTVRAVTLQTTHWPDVMTKQYMQHLPENVKDSFARSYRQLPSVADEARRFAKAHLEGRPVSKDFAYLGPIESKDAATLKNMVFTDDPKKKKQIKPVNGIDVKGYDFVIDSSVVGHIRAKHGNDAAQRLQGQRGVQADDYAKIPEVLNDPDTITPSEFSGRGLPLIAYTKEIGGEKYTVVMEYRKKRLALQTMYIKI